MSEPDVAVCRLSIEPIGSQQPFASPHCLLPSPLPLSPKIVMSNLLTKKRGIVTLSLDGGRWETLSPISQIDILEDVLSYYEFDNNIERGTSKVCDAFDLVVGTGTGGLIAFMFSVLKMTIKEARDAYIRLYHTAFAPEIRSMDERAELLRNALKHLLNTGSEGSRDTIGQLLVTKMNNVEPLSPGCKCAVTAMSTANTASPVLFRAYRGRNTSINCFPLEALLATLADVESYPAVEIETEKFISTNLGYFNPSEELLKEVASISMSDGSIAAVVSIGPGRPPPISTNGLEQFLHAVLEHAKDCQSASDRIKSRFFRHPDLYMRFEVDTLSFDKQDNETGRVTLDTITSHSRAYLNRDEICSMLGVLSHSLSVRPSRLKISQLSGLNPGVIDRIEEGIHCAALKELKISRDAHYNSAAAQELQRRTCTPNTRVNILQKIISWAKDSNQPFLSSLFWIFGLAGTGKRTIAQSVCETLKQEALLASSYFCSIQLDSKDSKLIIPTIASHLATRFPVFAKYLASALREDPVRASARITDQFRDLICDPWTLFSEEAVYRQSCVIVIDALDECDRGEEVLRLILDAIDHNQLQGIKFLATSRPVPRLVERALQLKRGPQIALHEVKKEEVSGDIRLFMEEELHTIVDSGTIHELTTRSDGLFIFASTLIKHLVPTSDFMTRLEIQERLRQILKPRHQGEEVGLYTLYDHILHDVLSLEKFGPEGLKQRLLVLQTIVSMEHATAASVISDFMGYDVEDVIGIVNALHAVLFTRGPNEPIYVIHASFHDFIISRAYGPFRCDPPSVHDRLTQACLSWMQEKLRFNICNIESSFTTNDDLPAPLESIGQSLAYACRHWWAHMMRCTEVAQKGMRQSICNMIEMKGIFWIEVMTLLGDERRCRDILTGIAFTSSMAPDPKRILFFEIKGYPSKLQSLALEAADMVSMFMSITPKMTSHLYLSVLSLWEGNNLQLWKSQFQRLPHLHSRRVDSNKEAQLIVSLGYSVTSVAFSPDGKRVISGTSDKTVLIWDADSGKQLRKLSGHGSSVTSVAYSLDGKRAVSGSSDKTVRIWDPDSGKQLLKLDGHEFSVKSVAFSPDGKRIISGSSDWTVRIWDADYGNQLLKLDGLESSVTSVTFSPNGRHIVTGSSDKTVHIWEADSGRQLRKLDDHRFSVTSVAFSPSGKQVISGSSDKTVQIWDTDSGKQLRKLDNHESSVTSVAFSPDGRRVISASSSSTVQIWDADSGKQLMKLDGHESSVTSVAFSPDGKRIISGSSDKSVRIWDADLGRQIQKPDGHESSVMSVAFSPDSRFVVSGSGDWTVRIWDTNSGKQLRKLDGHWSSVISVAYSPDGKRVVSGSSDKTVRIWNTNTGKQLLKLDGHGSSVTSIAFSPAGKRIVSGSGDKTVRIWDADSGKQLQKLCGHCSSVEAVAFSPNGKLVVSGSGNFYHSSDRTVRIWDSNFGKQLWKFDGHESLVSSVAFSPDSTRVISGSGDWTMRIWDMDSGKQTRRLDGHESSVTSVAFSPDGRHIASGSSDKTVRIWDTGSGRQLRKFDGHGSSITSVMFSPDSKRIISGSSDWTVRIWDADYGRQLRMLDGSESSARPFSPDGNGVVSQSGNTAVQIQGTDPGKNLGNLERLVRSISFFLATSPVEEHFRRSNRNTKYTSSSSLLFALSKSKTTAYCTLYLSPTSSSCYTCDDGWIVTSKEHTGVEHRIMWLPPSLRPYDPRVLMIMSQNGFNRIDLSGCAFGDGWSAISLEKI
ncbi:quinon protein alcohol dehydrogenase-like superfamily [Flagelloscypha sp. PMI_526]|nr:quinon protein alcohol dehydrogenase-like superfamily [Flagelloscypha sp. PMI_526]